MQLEKWDSRLADQREASEIHVADARTFGIAREADRQEWLEWLRGRRKRA